MQFHTKGFTSLFLTMTFIALTLSGAVLYVAPRCRVADRIGWTITGLEKGQWESIHINGALFFVVAGVLHLALNWSLLWGYIKKRGQAALNLKRELLAAVVLGSLVVAGSVLAWPPFHSVVELHEQIKDSWGRPDGQTPASHTVDPTVQELSHQMHLAVDQVIAALEAEGIAVPCEGATLGELAEASRQTPDEIRAAIRRQLPGAGQEARHDGRGRGLGGGGGRGGGGGGLGRGEGGHPHE